MSETYFDHSLTLGIRWPPPESILPTIIQYQRDGICFLITERSPTRPSSQERARLSVRTKSPFGATAENSLESV